jgi:hypothetical protein
MAQGGLDARRLLVGQAARTDHVGQLADVGELDRRPVGAPLADTDTAPARPKHGQPIASRPTRRRPMAAQQVERLLGVDIGRIGRQHRQDQLARWVVDALPGWRAVHRPQRTQRVRHEIGPRPIQPLDPGLDRIRLGALLDRFLDHQSSSGSMTAAGASARTRRSGSTSGIECPPSIGRPRMCRSHSPDWKPAASRPSFAMAASSS